MKKKVFMLLRSQGKKLIERAGSRSSYFMENVRDTKNIGK